MAFVLKKISKLHLHLEHFSIEFRKIIIITSANR